MSTVHLADILASGYESFCQQSGSSAGNHKVVRAITSCRTDLLGGHQYECPDCHAQASMHNSCGNRHCPQCQTLARGDWVAGRDPKVSFCLFRIFTPCSPYRHSSIRLFCVTRSHCMRFCFGASTRRCSSSVRRRGFLVHLSDLSLSCTRGDRTSWIIRISTASCLPAASRKMARGGYPARVSFCFHLPS